MNARNLLFTFMLTLYLLSCSTSPGLDELNANWKFHGLDSAAVHSIHERSGKLYAGTDQGVYISTDPDWTSWKGPKLDIEGIQYINLVVGKDQKIIAAVQYYPDYFEEENQVLFESSDNGETWKGINETVEGATRYGEPVSYFSSIKHFETKTDNLDVLFGYSGVISRSTDGGKNWEVVYDEGGESRFLKVSEDHPDHIWTGGRMPLPVPYLAASRDGGETWTMLNKQVSYQPEGTVWAGAVSPRDPEVVLLSLGPIRKTVDGGQTWQTVFDDFGASNLENGTIFPDRVYASVQHPSSKLSIAASNNYGDSWTTFVHEQGPEIRWINDMTVAEIDGKETVFLGTTKGVYSFRLEE